MRSYSHLSEDERDQIGVLRATGRSMGAIARALGGRKPPSPGSCGGTLSPRADIRRFMPLEPVNCAGGVKRSSNERPLYVCSWGIGSPRLDARTDLRLVEIRERTAAALPGCETIYAFIYRAAQKAEALWRYLDASPQTPSPAGAVASRDALSRIERRSMIVRRPLKAAARPAIGRATSSSANAHGLCSSCMSGKPRVTIAARLTGKTAAETISAMLYMFGRIDPQLRRSTTFDNDTAFAQHVPFATMRAI